MNPEKTKLASTQTWMRHMLLMCAAAALMVTSAWAQSPAAPAKPASAAAKTLAAPEIEGKTIEGKAFKLA